MWNSRDEFLKHKRLLHPGEKPAYYMNLWEKNEKLRTLIQSFEQLKSLNIFFEYVIADLSTEQGLISLSELINNVRIDCLIHGAGIQRSKLMKDKSAAEFSQIYQSKTVDSWDFLKSLSAHPLQKIILFSSIAAVNGNSGQADYAATNSVALSMPIFAKQLFPKTVFKVIAWPAWAEVGMATDKSVQQAMYDKGMDFISVDSGVEFFMQEYFDMHSSSVICTSNKNDFVTQHKVYLQFEQAQASYKLQAVINNKPYVDTFARTWNFTIKELQTCISTFSHDSGDLLRSYQQHAQASAK